ncbi:MAG: hypothetical protein BEN18_07725 [Epulopiscium sp. Nuni2H_MBin001]|nr:MAG: hypothetical protein BEN18_07725 [Epulopiscium sp. Nuni2H_MBin001]
MIYDVIIVGSGNSALFAAISAATAHLSVLVIENPRYDENTMHSENKRFLKQMHERATSLDVKFISEEITTVSLKENVKSINLHKATTVIFALYSKPRLLGFEQEELFIGKGISYCVSAEGELAKNKEVVIIGNNCRTIENAIFLTRYASKITIIVETPNFICTKEDFNKLKKYKRIVIKYNTTLTKVWGDKFVTRAAFKHNITKEEWEYYVETGFKLFICSGVEPATAVVKDILSLTAYGYIITDDNLHTNIEGVFACGELRKNELRYRMLRPMIVAVKEGSSAAEAAVKYIAKLGLTKAKTTDTPKAVLPKPKPKNKFITPPIANQLQGVFSRLTKAIILITVVDSKNSRSIELKEFLEELVVLTDKLVLKAYEKGENIALEQFLRIDKFPVVSMQTDEQQYLGIKFCGIPGGHELNSFILTIYNLGSSGQAIAEDDINRIKAINKAVNIKVAVSLSCHLCPDIVVASQRLAILNCNIETEMIDIALFENLRAKHKIRNVPAIIINDSKVVFGAKTLTQIIDLIE